MKTLAFDECNIFKEISNKNWNRAKKLMILCILNTDMSKHFEIVNKFKNVCELMSESKHYNEEKINNNISNKNILKDANDRDILC